MNPGKVNSNLFNLLLDYEHQFRTLGKVSPRTVVRFIIIFSGEIKPRIYECLARNVTEMEYEELIQMNRLLIGFQNTFERLRISDILCVDEYFDDIIDIILDELIDDLACIMSATRQTSIGGIVCMFGCEDHVDLLHFLNYGVGPEDVGLQDDSPLKYERAEFRTNCHNLLLLLREIYELLCWQHRIRRTRDNQHSVVWAMLNRTALRCFIEVTYDKCANPIKVAQMTSSEPLYDDRIYNIIMEQLADIRNRYTRFGMRLVEEGLDWYQMGQDFIISVMDSYFEDIDLDMITLFFVRFIYNFFMFRSDVKSFEEKIVYFIIRYAVIFSKFMIKFSRRILQDERIGNDFKVCYSMLHIALTALKPYELCQFGEETDKFTMCDLVNALFEYHSELLDANFIVGEEHSFIELNIVWLHRIVVTNLKANGLLSRYEWQKSSFITDLGNNKNIKKYFCNYRESLREVFEYEPYYDIDTDDCWPLWLQCSVCGKDLENTVWETEFAAICSSNYLMICYPCFR